MASPWLWAFLAIIALAVAGCAPVPFAVWGVLVGLAGLVIGFGVGLFVSDKSERRAGSVAVTRQARTVAEGKRASLRGANLRNADLRGANLTGADLENADLRGANLGPLADERR